MEIGDKVTINDEGLDGIFGSALGLAYMKTKVYTITNLIPIEGEPTLFFVEVDDEELNFREPLNTDFDLKKN